jgi:hypothetical protein
MILFVTLMAAPVMSQETLTAKAAMAVTSRIADLEVRQDIERNIELGNISSMEELNALLENVTLLDSSLVTEDDQMPVAERLNDLARRTRLLLEGYRSCENLRNEDLKDELHNLCSKHTALGYGGARKYMYSYVDVIDGRIEGVYTGKFFAPQSAGSNEREGTRGFMNCEHTWPQSFFNKQEPQRSDIWHLYPTDSDANGRRSSYPFGVVVGTPKWQEGGSKLGNGANGKTVFEPRDCHKGNVARSLFYFSVAYNDPIDALQEATLRKWHTQDPVDDNERERANRIEKKQKNRNPFIDHPEYVERINNF